MIMINTSPKFDRCSSGVGGIGGIGDEAAGKKRDRKNESLWNLVNK